MSSTLEKEAFSAGYKAGWKSRGDFIEDYRNAHSGTSFGVAMIALGLAIIVSLLLMPVIFVEVSFSLSAIIWPVLISAGVSTLGYFINKIEAKRYNAKVTDFNEKWGQA
jgi:hypothetical protein